MALANRGCGARDAPKGGSLIRLGIVDDHPVFRLGLIRTLEREADLSVAWELGSVTELYSTIDMYPVDVVLMDLNLGPDQDSLSATTAIRERYESIKVIVISASLDWEAASAARAAGASGYLPKDLAIADMVAAIRGLASPNFGRWAFTDMLEERGGKGAIGFLRRGLSRREQQVLSELRRGRTNKEIAAHLGVSLATVNKHVQHVLRKLHVRTRAQAVAMVDAETNGGPYLLRSAHA